MIVSDKVEKSFITLTPEQRPMARLLRPGEEGRGAQEGGVEPVQ